MSKVATDAPKVNDTMAMILRGLAKYPKGKSQRYDYFDRGCKQAIGRLVSMGFVMTLHIPGFSAVLLLPAGRKWVKANRLPKIGDR